MSPYKHQSKKTSPTTAAQNLPPELNEQIVSRKCAQ